MKNKIREQKGFAASDALIAVLLIRLFSGLIATISYNIYLSNSSIKRMSKATNYIIDVFEYIDTIEYDKVTKLDLSSYFNNKYYIGNKPEVKMLVDGENIQDVNTPFIAEINIVKYKDTEETLDTEGLDLVQEITMTVKYKLGNKDQVITMKRNKTKEITEDLTQVTAIDNTTD